jgi:uncharacterized membrane protein YdbT with pleckstrin-like domain
MPFIKRPGEVEMTNGYLKNLLGKNEEVLLVTRQHWIVLLADILPETILTTALVILISLIWLMWLPNPLVPFAYLLLLLPLISLLRDVLVWSNRQYIVTNRRVIQIAGVINKDVTDSSLEKVNDVKLEQSFWGRLLNFGTIEILTASELGVNRFSHLGRPVNFKKAMLNAKEQLDQGPTRSEGDIVDVIAQLDSLRKRGVLSEEEFQQKKTDLLAKL